MPLTVAIAVALIPASGAAAPVLRVSISQGLDCPAPTAIVGTLSRRFGPERIVVGSLNSDDLGLSVFSLPGALELDLIGRLGDLPFRRRLPLGEGSCADVAETIGLLVDAWLRDLPWHGAGFLRDVPEAGRGSPSVQVVALEPPAVTATAALPQPQPPARPFFAPRGLELRVGGGASLAGDATGFGPEVSLTADLGFSHGLGAALQASILENASAQDRLSSGTAASASVSRQTFALAARYALFGNEGNGPRVFVGFALEAFEARSSGFTTDSPTSEVAPAGFVAVLWQQRLWQRLWIYGQLAATLGPPVDFEISKAGGPQPVLTVPFGLFDGSLGLALQMF